MNPKQMLVHASKTVQLSMAIDGSILILLTWTNYKGTFLDINNIWRPAHV